MPERSASRRFVWALLLVALLGLGVRVAYILTERTGPGLEAAPGVGGGDAYFYTRSAQLLWDHGFVSPEVFDGEGRIEEAANHPPLYTLWLAIPTAVGIDSAGALMLWSAVLGTATVVVTGLAGRTIAGDRAGLVAALLAAVYPNVWSHDGFLMSESIAILTTTLVVWLAYRYWRAPGAWGAAALSFACALAALSRAEMLLLFPAVVLPLLLARGRGGDLRARVRRVGIAALAALVPIAPWVVFNLTRFAEPVFISTGFGITLQTSNCDDTYYGPFVGYWSRRCAVEFRAREVDPLLDQSEEEPIFRDEALDYVRAHLSRVPAVVLARIGRITGAYQPEQMMNLEALPEGREKWVTQLSWAMYYPLVLLAIGGVWVLRRRRVPLYPVVAPIATALFAVAITFATVRYRATAETALVLLAAVAIDAALRRVTRAPSYSEPG